VDPRIEADYAGGPRVIDALEEEELDARGVSGEHAEVDAFTNARGSER